MPQQQPIEHSDPRRAELVCATRAAIGDTLRSLVYFTPDDHVQLYLRADLEADADLGRFVEHETCGFEAHEAYTGTELGSYRFTVRAFEQGFLMRVTTDEEGVFLTTDGLTLHDFQEVASALAFILQPVAPAPDLQAS